MKKQGTLILTTETARKNYKGHLSQSKKVKCPSCKVNKETEINLELNNNNNDDE